jgi:hypothetical protein
MRRQALAIRERCIVPDFRELLWEFELYAILVNALHIQVWLTEYIHTRIHLAVALSRLMWRCIPQVHAMSLRKYSVVSVYQREAMSIALRTKPKVLGKYAGPWFSEIRGLQSLGGRPRHFE